MADKAQELETREDANALADSGSQKEESVHTPAAFPSEEIMTTLSGRVRKSAQVFTFTRVKSDDAGEFTPAVGKGVKVRDVEYVRENVEALGKQQCEMIRQLYSIMFGRRFQQKNMKAIKEHILDFSGIVEQDEKSREHLVAKMSKWKMPFVHDVMDLLAVHRSKKSFDEEGKVPNKEALLERLVDWLYNPQKTKLAEKKSATLARKAKQKTKKRAKAAKKSESEPVTKKRKTTKKKSVAVTKDDDADNLEATESEGEESCSDFEDVKKKKKKTAKKGKVTSRTTTSRIAESDNEDDVSEKETGESAEKSKKRTGKSAEKSKKGTGKSAEKSKKGTGKSAEKSEKGTDKSAEKNETGAAEKSEKETGGSTEKREKGTGGPTEKSEKGAGGSTEKSGKGTGGSTEKSEEGTDGSTVKCEKQSTAKEKPVAKSANEANIADKADVESEVETLDTDTRSKIRDIICKGNAEELTVKKILRQLSADLGRDMSAQKNAIKEFITNDQAET
uniref:DEK-C domain-containing protein n=1 Tax=Peronospora matthiolae TaxID=2874970 RepID=A0AAV1U1Z2_9STRA